MGSVEIPEIITSVPILITAEEESVEKPTELIMHDMPANTHEDPIMQGKLRDFFAITLGIKESQKRQRGIWADKLRIKGGKDLCKILRHIIKGH